MTEPADIDDFLAGTPWADARRVDLAGDASARRYQRFHLPGRSAVLMDARSEDPASTKAFLRIAGHLRESGLSAPEILAQDAARGLILLEDFGDGVFAALAQADPARQDELYRVAVDVLVHLHRLPAPGGLIRFDAALMADQAMLVYDHYAASRDTDAKKAFQANLETVLTRHILGDPVLILRDYHAENLIWLPGRTGVRRAGLLDFQDAMAGPVGYDLVSLLFDARRDVPADLARAMARHFCDATGTDPGPFAAGMAALSAQRSLRILGIFARLSQVSGKTHYIDLVPRVWGHLMTALDHPALAALSTLIHRDLPPPDPAHLNWLRCQC